MVYYVYFNQYSLRIEMAKKLKNNPRIKLLIEAIESVNYVIPLPFMS